MELSNSRLLTEQESFANANGVNWGSFWNVGKKTTTDEQLARLAQEGSTAMAAQNSNVGQGSANSGRREEDGSKWWKDILIAGADVINQYGNQGRDDYNPQGWNDTVNDTWQDEERETKILGMHPLTFGAVAIGVVIVGGIVAYQLTKNKS